MFLVGDYRRPLHYHHRRRRRRRRRPPSLLQTLQTLRALRILDGTRFNNLHPRLYQARQAAGGMSPQA